MKKSVLNLVLLGLLTTQAGIAADLKLDDGHLNASDLVVRQRLAQKLEEISASPEQYEDALYQGQRRASLCKVCHGEDGNSVREGTPNLAGQDPVYIVDQFNRYADGRRIDYWMGSLAASFSDEDKIKLAIFYAAQATKPARGGNTLLLDRGEQIYRSLCAECHGEDGRSKEGYARLAGQRPEYTVKMLREFRSPAGRRYNPLMYARAFMLRSDEDIEAVATYLAHLD
jgi:cytochrome c553